MPAVKSGIYRLKKDKKIMSPIKGFYVILSPEHRKNGSIPLEQLAPLLMEHLNAEYYVSLLSGAAYYGSAHQKPMKMQVITNYRIKRPLICGKGEIDFIYKKTLSGLPVLETTNPAGYLKIASPELIAVDLLKYSLQSCGLNHIYTVLSELIDHINISKIVALMDVVKEKALFQRLGFLLNMIQKEEKCKLDQFEIFEKQVQSIAKVFVPLDPSHSIQGYYRDKNWKVISNVELELDE